MAGPSALCYCHSAVPDTAMMVCGTCKKTFHPGCLKTGRPSSLEGDIFYQFTCTQCSESGQEEVDRLKLSWLQVVMLTLYNLQLSGNGKYGFFRWKEHICAFIDKHWTTFFGYSRKKTNLWYGTVAGTLSSGCPAYFLSGAQELNEPGWWRLTKMKPPSLKLDPPSRLSRRYKLESDQTIKVESLRSRRGKTSSIEAAMELKAKRATLTEAKDLRKRTTRNSRNSDSSLGSEDRSLSAESLTPPVSVTSGDKGQGDMDRKFGVVAASGSPFQLQPIKTERLEEPMETTDGRSSGLGKRSSLFGRDLEDDTSSQFSHASSKTDMYLTERDLWAKGTLPEFLLKDDEDDENDSDLEIDPGTFSPPRTDSPLPMSQSPSLCDILSSIDDSSRHTTKTEMSEISGHVTVPKVKVKEEEDIETDLSSSSEDSRGATEENSTADVNDTLVQRTEEKGKAREEAPPQKKPEVRLVPMSRYEESDLLRRLNQAAENCTLEPDLARFRRKLIVRQVKQVMTLNIAASCKKTQKGGSDKYIAELQREHGQKVFNLDWEVKRSLGQLEQLDSRASNHPLNPHRLPTSQSGASETRVLDRFQLGRYERRILTARPTSFLTRLVGTQDSELQPITSPYTARTLKPFIRRDYESKPLKLRLLEEIKAYPHRKQLSWETPPSYPIDYCYVRPQHIPSVNTLCAEFFWPGIDLSECLQYPDFSCVVLYRKVVIAFAFMVPDTKYNEAYISFIFSHPEWRQAGIGTFMLYHLIQTCMGKDVTLHVSATNPAMLLYQKFGFKPEEFILDFYDKYYPVDSVACKHAFLLRLRR